MTTDSNYVWTRDDQADHEAGHPSGYDCDGYAVLPPGESCARSYWPDRRGAADA